MYSITMPYKDIEKRREHHREYIKKYRESNENKEKEKTQQTIYKQKNKEKINKTIKEWYDRNSKTINTNKRKLHAQNPQILKDSYKKSKKEICILCGKPARRKYCSKKCMGIGIEGKGNTFYNGGNREGYPITWTKRFKRYIRERDKFTCMKCGIRQIELSEALDVHHIDGIKKNTYKENCISFCKKCHSIIETRSKKEKKQNIFFYHKLLKELYQY